jgi:hypothetical protein
MILNAWNTSCVDEVFGSFLRQRRLQRACFVKTIMLMHEVLLRWPLVVYVAFAVWFDTLRYYSQHQYQDLLNYKRCVTPVYNLMTILLSLYYDSSYGRGHTSLHYALTLIIIRTELMFRCDTLVIITCTSKLLKIITHHAHVLRL